MTSSTRTDVALPDKAKTIIWRIFGAGESPLTGRSTFHLIEPIVSEYVTPSTERDRSIAAIQGWFEVIGERRWLRQELREAVAVLIVDGIGTNRSETAIWAIGSIDSDLAVKIVCSRWCPEEIDSFVDAGLATLEKVCVRDAVLNAARVVPHADLDSGKGRIPRDSVQREGRLETFQHLSSHHFDLVHHALHRPVGNLIELIIGLQPERFESLIERLDHPVVQARAAYHLVHESRTLDHRKPLLWITLDSCDASIALAIVHTLETVNGLDKDIRTANRRGEDRPIWSTELRHPNDDLDAAATNLLKDLVDRLAILDPHVSMQWIGELLSSAPYVLMQGGDFEKPERIDQLESMLTELIVRLVHQSWSDDLPAALCSGLRLTSRTTWTRHLASAAWELRNTDPARAAILARKTLDEHEPHVAKEMGLGHMFWNWDDWHDREWVAGLGATLALSNNELDLREWISTRCRELPLTVWDAEESYKAFSTADRAAQVWFLVALQAVACLKEIDRAVNPGKVCALAEAAWTHCYFTGHYLSNVRGASVLAEHAARYAIEFGEPSELWLLEQARNPKVGPRALWGLIDQRKKKAAREEWPSPAFDELVIDEITRAASNRFEDGEHFDFESLHHWGHLWLSLSATSQGVRTANEIFAFPIRGFDRGSKLLVLQLLAQGIDPQGLNLDTRDRIASIYRELWPVRGYTTDTERTARQEIDELLERSGIPVP